MQHALDLKHLPLTNDAEAQRWCTHDETLVRAAVLHAVGREQFVQIAQWLSDVQSEHFHASTMLFTLATDASVFDSSERKMLLLQSSELITKAREAPGWTDTKERMNHEFGLNQKMLIALELGSSAATWMERNVEISRHALFAADPEKKASSLMNPIFHKQGWTQANPTPSPQELREASSMVGEMCR